MMRRENFLRSVRTIIPYVITAFFCVLLATLNVIGSVMQEVFARRLEQFYASTSPLLAYYSGRAAGEAPTKLVTLAGRTSDEIWPQLETVIRTRFPMVKERQESKRRTSLSDAVLARREFDSKNRVKAALNA